MPAHKRDYIPQVIKILMIEMNHVNFNKLHMTMDLTR